MEAVGDVGLELASCLCDGALNLSESAVDSRKAPVDAGELRLDLVVERVQVTFVGELAVVDGCMASLSPEQRGDLGESWVLEDPLELLTQVEAVRSLV